MFSQKRKRQNWLPIILIIIIAVMLAAAAIIITKNYVDRKSSQYINDIQTSTEIPYKDYSDDYDEDNNDNDVYLAEDNDSDSENKEKNQDEGKNDELDTPYFIIRESNNIIKVFFHKNGNEKYLQDTEIIFDTLSEEDQKRFKDGITVNTEEELNKLIMDYES